MNKERYFSSGYSLELYCNCDQYKSDPAIFTADGPNAYAIDFKQARDEGWKISVRNRTAVCPNCCKK